MEKLLVKVSKEIACKDYGNIPLVYNVVIGDHLKHCLSKGNGL